MRRGTCLFFSVLVVGWCSSRAHRPHPASLPRHWPEASSSPTKERFGGASGITIRTKPPKTNTCSSEFSADAPLLRDESVQRCRARPHTPPSSRALGKLWLLALSDLKKPKKTKQRSGAQLNPWQSTAVHNARTEPSFYSHDTQVRS